MKILSACSVFLVMVMVAPLGRAADPVYLSGYNTMEVEAVSWAGYPGGTADPNGTYTFKERIDQGNGFCVTDVYENGDLRIKSTVFSFGAKQTSLVIATEGSTVSLWEANGASIDEVLGGSKSWAVSPYVNTTHVDRGGYVELIGNYDFTGGQTSLTAPLAGGGGGGSGGATADIPFVDGLTYQDGVFLPAAAQ